MPHAQAHESPRSNARRNLRTPNDTPVIVAPCQHQHVASRFVMVRPSGNPGHLPRVLDNGSVAPLGYEIIISLKAANLCVRGELAVTLNSFRYVLGATLTSGRNEHD